VGPGRKPGLLTHLERRAVERHADGRAGRVRAVGAGTLELTVVVDADGTAIAPSDEAVGLEEVAAATEARARRPGRASHPNPPGGMTARGWAILPRWTRFSSPSG